MDVDLKEIVGGLPNTRLLYFHDSYRNTFDAEVLRAVKEQGRSWYIVLDQTCFHPKGGGQPTDTGRLRFIGGSAQVKKAMFEGAVVVHYVKLEGDTPPKVGDRVSGSVDWPQRYIYMRRHTSAHLFDHCINQASGKTYRTLGSWLGGPKPYVDYGGEQPSLATIELAETLANNYIGDALDVTIEFVDKQALKDYGDAPNIWRLPENDTYRVVRIDGFEKIPCGGTHVRKTSEIRRLKVLGTDLANGGFRVYFDVDPVHTVGN